MGPSREGSGANESCPAHYGVRTRTHKLICYYNDPLDQVGARGPSSHVEWELFDRANDPLEVHNLYGQPDTDLVTAELCAELARIQKTVGDTPYP